MPRKKKISFWPKKKVEHRLPREWDSSAVHVEPSEPDMSVSERLIQGQTVGVGGLCTVESAFDINLLRSVAKKVIQKEHAHDESMCGRLIEEAQITAQLDHPNIIPVHELGVDEDGDLYFSMKLVQGKTLNELFDELGHDRRRAGDLFQLLQIFLKVCDAVDFAHSKEVIHQDLKPDNIMIGEFGEVYVMDWGFARLKTEERPSKNDIEALGTQKRHRFNVDVDDGLVTATLFYMAPEQARGDHDNIDARTDIFCLGGILYKMLTRMPPYDGDDPLEVYKATLEAKIQPPQDAVDFDLPPRLCGICMKALSKDPAERYQTVAEFKEDVESFLQCGWQFQRKKFAKGAVIVREGDKGDEAYIVTRGRCRVFTTFEGNLVDLGELTVGDVFGELSIFSDQPRAASIEALDQVTVIVVTRKHFEEDLGMSFWLGLFVKSLADRFLESSRKVVELEQLLEDVTRPDKTNS